MRKITFLLCAIFICATFSQGQTWQLTETMTESHDFSSGLLIISTTEEGGEAMPDYEPYSPLAWQWGQMSPWWGLVEIKSVVIKDKVTSIGRWAFLDQSITSVLLSNSVNRIEIGAFNNCGGLKSITIPRSVTFIGSSAFGSCRGLTDFTVWWDTPLQVEEVFGVFPSIVQNITLHVPAGTKDLYEKADVWKFCGTIKETSVQFGETQPVIQNGEGNISLRLYAPSDAAMTGGFKIQLPEGMTLDQNKTVLADDLAGSSTLSFSPEANNTWQIEINPGTLRNAVVTTSDAVAEYLKIMDIVFNVNDNFSTGVYEAVITNLNITPDGGTPIQENLLTVPVYIENTPTANETINVQSLQACVTNGVLYVAGLPAGKPFSIYSISGQLVHQGTAKAETEQIPLHTQGVFIIVAGNQAIKAIVK